MKKILISIFAIAAVAAAAGIGSWAYWNDTETSTGNSITADKLDLKLSLDDGANWLDDDQLSDLGIIPIVIEDTYPGATGGPATIKVKNESSAVTGVLNFRVNNVTDFENDLVEPEVDAGDDDTTGELCDNVKVTVAYDGTVYVDAKPLTDPVFTSSISLGNLTPNAEKDLTVSYEVDTAAGNNTMTDKCTFDLEADLQQVH